MILVIGLNFGRCYKKRTSQVKSCLRYFIQRGMVASIQSLSVPGSPHTANHLSRCRFLRKCVTGRDSVSPFPSKTPPITTLRWSYEEEGQGRGEQGVLAEIKVEMLMVAKSVVRTDNPVQKSHAQLHSSTQKYQIDDSTVEQILHQVPSAPA